MYTSDTVKNFAYKGKTDCKLAKKTLQTQMKF